MRLFYILILLYCSYDIYSQVEYFNHNDCDKYTMRYWDNNKLDSLKIPKLLSSFSLDDFFDFQDSINDLTIIKYINSNILINRLILFDECFTGKCSCDYLDKLDKLFQAFSNKQARIKLLGYYRPLPRIYSLIVLYQLQADSADEVREMNAYLINFNDSKKVISTALIGHLNRSGGIRFGEFNLDILINDNLITLKPKKTNQRIRADERFQVSGFYDKIYNIRINTDGQVEILK